MKNIRATFIFSTLLVITASALQMQAIDVQRGRALLTPRKLFECGEQCVYSSDCTNPYCPFCDLSAYGGGGGFFGYCVSGKWDGSCGSMCSSDSDCTDPSCTCAIFSGGPAGVCLTAPTVP